MNKLLVIAFLICAATPVMAAFPTCPRVEFVELQSMTEDELNDLVISYNDTGHRIMKQGGPRDGSFEAGVLCWNESTRVSNVRDKKIKARKKLESTEVKED